MAGPGAVPPARTSVRDADWYGEDPSGREHTRMALPGVDLGRTAFTGTRLREADPRGSDLSAVDPREVELAGAQIDLPQAGGDPGDRPAPARPPRRPGAAARTRY